METTLHITSNTMLQAGSPVAKPRSKANWFPGLNGLRFLAAALVVLMHIHNNMGLQGLPQLPAWPVLFKGLTAVSFFFVLSGFLITYLLLQEQKNTQTISIRAFYLRRVFRIWPLYFIVIVAGVFFYWKIVPAMHMSFESDYPHGLAIALYVFFLANLMNSLYHVGGMLHITWSIAVEEQFYLFWAPLSKKFQNKMPWLITMVTLTSLTLHALNTFNVFHCSKGMQAFIGTLQFHYMGFGAGFAWLLFNRKEWLLQLPIFSNKVLQFLCLGALIAYFLFYMKSFVGDLLSPIPLALLFGWLIISVSSNPKSIVGLENRPLNYLGKISYGIYMYHMPMVYATTFFFKKYFFLTKGPLYFPLFFLMVFLLVIVIASFSYFYVEQPILKRGNKLKKRYA
ncbi:MAG: acyltransferase [Bacteroidetes bacterium]|nr:acyltransferase [Bacteroidota bacterium]